MAKESYRTVDMDGDVAKAAGPLQVMTYPKGMKFTVEVEFDDDVGFLGLAFDLRETTHDAPIRALAASSASFSSARPMVVRRYPGIPTSRISTPSSR